MFIIIIIIIRNGDCLPVVWSVVNWSSYVKFSVLQTGQWRQEWLTDTVTGGVSEAVISTEQTGQWRQEWLTRQPAQSSPWQDAGPLAGAGSRLRATAVSALSVLFSSCGLAVSFKFHYIKLGQSQPLSPAISAKLFLYFNCTGRECILKLEWFFFSFLNNMNSQFYHGEVGSHFLIKCPVRLDLFLWGLPWSASSLITTFSTVTAVTGRPQWLSSSICHPNWNSLYHLVTVDFAGDLSPKHMVKLEKHSW